MFQTGAQSGRRLRPPLSPDTGARSRHHLSARCIDSLIGAVCLRRPFPVAPRERPADKAAVSGCPRVSGVSAEEVGDL